MGGHVDCVFKALNRYRELISSSRCVVMGDLNSSVRYTSMCPAYRNHATLLELFASMGFVSAYHSFDEEEQGRESQSTFYDQWSELKPFHIDYCFIPGAWQRRITGVKVDAFEPWRTASDHRPLIVDIDFDREGAVRPIRDRSG